MPLLLRVFTLLLLVVVPVQAQDSEPVVPDVSGIAAPVAAARLNQAGFRLGTQTLAIWTAESGVPQNTIVAQSPAPGSTAAHGSVVDVTVVRVPNISLVYDDNDLTVMNRSDEPLALNALRFSVVEGSPASLAATRWTDRLRERECLQVWSVARNGPKDVEGCRFIQNWFSTGDVGEHFWTQTSGAQRFDVTENGVERAICAAAPPDSQDSPSRCDFFLEGDGPLAEAAPYVYFAYTPQVIALINTSDDRWMLAGNTILHNYNPNIAVPGASLRFGDPALYGNPDIVADIQRLAPGQCLVMTSDDPDAQPPEACEAIAQLDLASTTAFWLADFEIEGATAAQRYACPAAVQGHLILCVMPHG